MRLRGSGGAAPNGETLQKLAKYFDVPTDFLLGIDTILKQDMLQVLSAEECELLTMFRKMPSKQRKCLSAFAKTMLENL